MALRRDGGHRPEKQNPSCGASHYPDAIPESDSAAADMMSVGSKHVGPAEILHKLQPDKQTRSGM